jgi:parallel beta-helix repeat protein
MANNVTVKSFTVRKSGTYPYCGIFVDHSTDNVIVNNKVMSNSEGISLLYSSSNMVCDNTISDNNDGIALYSSSNNVVSGNTIFSSKYGGIDLYFSSNNVISGNVILQNNFTGMSFYYSGTNVVYGNTISNNSQGIHLLSSGNNVIYNNNFDNANQVRSDLKNSWNYNYEGNYWSNYSGQDLNKDGIGDTPYDIDSVNKDNYPLIGMFYNFSVTLDKRTYSITVISNSTISAFNFQIGAETGNKIIYFNATGKDGALGFCRVKIPTGLINYPHIVLLDNEEIIPAILDISNEAYTYLYFAYLYENHTIIIISSKTFALYYELLDDYLKLQQDLYDLNETYYILLGNYNIVLINYTQLQIILDELNNSYQELFGLSIKYEELLGNYLKLQQDLYDLNETYLEHLLEYSEQMQNIRNLTYILVALATILIIITVYLSKRSHTNVTTRD